MVLARQPEHTPGVDDVATDAGDGFIFTCKPTSHKALYDFIDGAELSRHEEKRAFAHVAAGSIEARKIFLKRSA
jgi:hypothetical protein